MVHLPIVMTQDRHPLSSRDGLVPLAHAVGRVHEGDSVVGLANLQVGQQETKSKRGRTFSPQVGRAERLHSLIFCQVQFTEGVVVSSGIEVSGLQKKVAEKYLQS
jgi:hypothetical protein